jgi:predicted Zn-dependent protease
MKSTDERIAKAKARVKQLEQQKSLQEQQERKALAKREKRRNAILGEIYSSVFPKDVARFQPRRSKAENETEFAPLKKFLTALAEDTGYVALLKANTGWDESPSRE